MMTAFRAKSGKHIPEEKFPAHSYCEAFVDKLAIGALKAEPLSMVVSAFEEELQDRNKPDPIRQYGLSLGAKLTITTKKRPNMWLLAQMKQPGRSIYWDFDKSTFMDFLETLLDKKNFNLHKEVNCTLLLVPKWTDCISYDFEVRKEAHRLCREEGAWIKAALSATLENTEHRIIHWLQLISKTLVQAEAATMLPLNENSTNCREKCRAVLGYHDDVQPLALHDAPQQKRVYNGNDRARINAQKQRQNKRASQGGSSSARFGRSSSRTTALFAVSTSGNRAPKKNVTGNNKPYDDCLCLNNQFN